MLRARMIEPQTQKKQNRQAVDLQLKPLGFDELELIPTAPTSEDQEKLFQLPMVVQIHRRRGHLCMNPSPTNWLQLHQEVEPR